VNAELGRIMQFIVLS